MPPDAVTLSPREKPPLGRLFYILFYAPVAISIASAAMTSLAAIHGDLPHLGLMCYGLNLPAMPACAVFSAVIASKRRTTEFGMRIFMGAVLLYFAVAFVSGQYVGWNTRQY
jgi:hypothetical protein